MREGASMMTSRSPLLLPTKLNDFAILVEGCFIILLSYLRVTGIRRRREEDRFAEKVEVHEMGEVGSRTREVLFASCAVVFQRKNHSCGFGVYSRLDHFELNGACP